jgi:glutaredoxin-like protein NrdH
MPDCSQCETTKAFLNKHDIAFEAIDITTSPKDYEVIKSMGYDRVPVVVTTDDGHWQGFRPDKLFKLTK